MQLSKKNGVGFMESTAILSSKFGKQINMRIFRLKIRISRIGSIFCVMAKQAVLSMAGLLKASADEPEARERRMVTLIGILQDYVLSSEDVGEITAELLSGQSHFSQEEIRRIRRALNPEGSADEVVPEQTASKRRKNQDYCRMDRFLSTDQWQKLLLPSNFREKADRLVEIAFLLGCRLPSEQSMGWWTALLSLMTKEDTAYALRCNLGTVRSSWKAVSKRMLKLQASEADKADKEDLLPGLPSNAASLPACWQGAVVPATAEQRPFLEADLASLACKVPLRSTRGSISLIRQGSQPANAEQSSMQHLCQILNKILEQSSRREPELPGFKILAGMSSSGAQGSSEHKTLSSVATVKTLEADLQKKALGDLLAGGPANEALPLPTSSCLALPAPVEPDAQDTGKKIDGPVAPADSAVQERADAVEDHLRGPAAGQSGKMKRPASAKTDVCSKKPAAEDSAVKVLKRPSLGGPSAVAQPAKETPQSFKRPAGAHPVKGASMKRPAAASKALKDDHKNRASRAYHRARKQALREGLSQEKAKELARAAHRSVA